MSTCQLKNQATILVAGMISADPFQGGATWAVLQYVLGLAGLGHDVYFVEPIQRKAVRPEGADLNSSANAAYFRQVVKEFGLERRATLLSGDGTETVGLSLEALRRVARQARLLVNISGMLEEESLLSPIPIRLYMDLDPAFIQLWSAEEGIDMRFAAHTHFATIGLALGETDCPVPTCGLPWIKTKQPIVLERWPVAERLVDDAFTTVGNWRGYGSVSYRGSFYGQKAHSFRQFFELPTLSRERFILALAIHPDEERDLAALRANGWVLRDPCAAAGDPWSYQRFIQGSLAEFGVAKSGYVVSRCGWFSDRSVCYLASGRPVVAQETGFSRFLPTGEGLLAFSSNQDALAAIEKIRRDYPRHCQSARQIAESEFDSRGVLARLLNKVGL